MGELRRTFSGSIEFRLSRLNSPIMKPLQMDKTAPLEMEVEYRSIDNFRAAVMVYQFNEIVSLVIRRSSPGAIIFGCADEFLCTWTCKNLHQADGVHRQLIPLWTLTLWTSNLTCGHSRRACSPFATSSGVRVCERWLGS